MDYLVIIKYGNNLLEIFGPFSKEEAIDKFQSLKENAPGQMVKVPYEFVEDRETLWELEE